MTKPENVDQYLQSGCGRCKFGGTPQCKVHSWSEELYLLRKILQASSLTEEIKWGVPCYTHDGKNILLLSALKDSVTLSFFRGAEMQDPGENSRFARYMRFTDTQALAVLKHAIPAYIQEAIALENAGKKVDASTDAPLEYPEELTQLFATPILQKPSPPSHRGGNAAICCISHRQNRQKPERPALKSVCRRFSVAKAGTNSKY